MSGRREVTLSFVQSDLVDAELYCHSFHLIPGWDYIVVHSRRFPRWGLLSFSFKGRLPQMHFSWFISWFHKCPGVPFLHCTGWNEKWHCYLRVFLGFKEDVSLLLWGIQFSTKSRMNPTTTKKCKQIWSKYKQGPNQSQTDSKLKSNRIQVNPNKARSKPSPN